MDKCIELIKLIENLDDPDELFDNIEIIDIIVMYSHISKEIFKIILEFKFKGEKFVLVLSNYEGECLAGLHHKTSAYPIRHENISLIFESLEEEIKEEGFNEPAPSL